MRLPRLPSLSLVGREAAAAARRFPWVVGISVLTAAYAIWVIGVTPNEPSLDRVMFPLTLGIPVFLAAALYRERPLRPLGFDGAWLNIGVTALLVAYFLVVADDETTNVYTRFAQLHLAAMLAVAFAAFTLPGAENGFWQFNRERFFRFLLSATYSAVCFIGLSIALAAVHHLFDVKFDKAYPRIWVACAFVLLPWHFLASIPRALDGLEKDRTYPAPLRLFGQYLLMPLVFVYMAILYTYMGKIVWTREWPQGLVAWMVSGMSIFGVLVLLLLHPFQRVRGQAWIRAGGRWFYALILPLLAMHLTALGKRLGQYGFTEHRYIQLMLALWLGGLSVSFLTGLARNIKVVPMSLCALALLTFVGPWSAYAVSLRSQRARLESILTRNHLWEGGRTHRKTTAVSYDDWQEIRNLVGYLYEHHGGEAVARYHPGVRTRLAPEANRRHRAAYSGQYEATTDIMTGMGLKDAPPQQARSDGRFAFSAREASDRFAPVTGYDGVLEFKYDLDEEFGEGGTRWKTHLEKGGRTLSLSRDGKLVGAFDLFGVASRLVNARGSEDARVPIAEMSLMAQVGELRFQLCLRELHGKLERGRVKIYGGNGYLLIKRNAPA